MTTYAWFEAVDIVFTVIFGVEMVLKMYALGLYSTSGSYFKSCFNVIDVIVVISAIFTHILAAQGLEVAPSASPCARSGRFIASPRCVW